MRHWRLQLPAVGALFGFLQMGKTPPSAEYCISLTHLFVILSFTVPKRVKARLLGLKLQMLSLKLKVVFFTLGKSNHKMKFLTLSKSALPVLVC